MTGDRLGQALYLVTCHLSPVTCHGFYETLAAAGHLRHGLHRSDRVRDRHPRLALLRRGHEIQRDAARRRVAVRVLLRHAVDLYADPWATLGSLRAQTRAVFESARHEP